MGILSKKKLLASTVAFFVGGGAGVTSAQEQAAVEDKESGWLLEEVVVTATRRESSLQDVPMAVSTIDPDQFKGVGLTNLQDVVAYTPGVTFTPSTLSPIAGAVSVRGVSQLGGSFITATTGVYVDAIPTTSNSPWGVVGFSFDGLLGDVERVEFLKGPQGTLYGSTSIGGAVKYITKKPSLEEFGGRITIDPSVTGGGGFNQLYNARASMPIVEDKLGVALAGYWEDAEGYVDRVDETGNLVEKNANGYDRYGVSADLYFKLSEDFSFRGRVFHQEAEYTGVSNVDLDPETKNSIYGYYANSEGINRREYSNTLYSGTIETVFDGAILTATSSYLEEERSANGDLINTLRPFLNFFFPSHQNLSDTAISVTSIPEAGSEKFTQEIQLTSTDSGNWEWILGFYYADETTFRDSDIIIQPQGVVWRTSERPSDYEEYATFGNLTYFLTPKLDITLGARISQTEMSFEEISTSDSPFLSGGAPFTVTKDTVDTWSLALGYRLEENLSLYARAASGYRPATANIQVADLTGRVQDFVEADSLWSYELGAKGILGGGALSYDVALWYLDWENFQAEQIAPITNLVVLGNASDGITGKGVEGSITWMPIEGLSFVSNVAYTDSTLNEDEPNLDGTKGQSLPRVPKWTFSTRAQYEFFLKDGLGANLGAGIRYEEGSRSAFTDGDGVSEFNLPSDDYTVLDINAGLNWNNVLLNLYATNVLNEKAMVRTSHTPSNASGIPLEPRTVGFSLSLDF